jgi:hypothetical protein
MAPDLSRREFLAAAISSGAALAIAPALQPRVRAAAEAAAAEGAGGYYLDARELATCAALCARIVPTGANPATDPGATEAHAVLFIDRFLAAFELPAAVADHPAIYLHGRYSGRDPYPDDSTGAPSTSFPPDDFATSSTQGTTAHFLPLGRLQALSWRYQLYGADAVKGADVSPKWKAQLGALNPAPAPLRPLYRAGLAAFESYAQSSFHGHFADLSPTQQDVLIASAGNVVLANVPLPSPPGAPPAAKSLFSALVVHTFQACYGLPEYRGLTTEPGLWRALGWDGDTVPLGSSVYDENLHGPGQGPNRGFGDPAVFEPRGGYREFRPVSTLGRQGDELSEADVAELVDAIRARRLRPRFGKHT